MSDTAHEPDTETHEDSERTTIRSGRDFEREYRVSASEAGKFFVALGEQLQTDDELTLVGDEWELPFAFGEPAALEIDFEGVGDTSLEVELELPGRADETAPDVE